MRKWRKALIAAACLTATVILAAFLTRDPEPQYQGRSLSEWQLVWSHTADDNFETNEATIAIRHIGTNALPFALKRLRSQPSRFRTTLASCVEKLPPALSRIFPPEADEPLPEIVFDVLGPAASPAISELTDLLHSTNNPHAACRAAYCLAAIGKDGLPPLLNALAGPKSPGCYHVADLFAYSSVIGPRALDANLPAAVPLLARCALGEDRKLALTAISALGHIGTRPEISIPVLTNALLSTDLELRTNAVKALSMFGDAGVPFLLKATRDSNAIVREVAANWLEMVAPELLTNAPAK